MTSDGPVVVLAGGTGGAKLARGMLDVVGEDLVVVANTGDDVEIYGGYVSPDPDLISFWLADRIDARGWGLQDDTFHVMDGLRELGVDVWFNLGDRDLAIALERARALDQGQSLTQAHQRVTAHLHIAASVLPMADRPVRTHVLAGERWWPLQEFMIRRRGEGPVEDVQFRGASNAQPTAQVTTAIQTARAIVIGPSNPIISIGPILALPGMREAITASPAPVVAVSPLVHNSVVKGPTAAFLAYAGHPVSSDGIAAIYAGLIDGLVADAPAASTAAASTAAASTAAAKTATPTHITDVLLDTPDRRRATAQQTLTFALTLAS